MAAVIVPCPSVPHRRWCGPVALFAAVVIGLCAANAAVAAPGFETLNRQHIGLGYTQPREPTAVEHRGDSYVAFAAGSAIVVQRHERRYSPWVPVGQALVAHAGAHVAHPRLLSIDDRLYVSWVETAADPPATVHVRMLTATGPRMREIRWDPVGEPLPAATAGPPPALAELDGEPAVFWQTPTRQLRYVWLDHAEWQLAPTVIANDAGPLLDAVDYEGAVVVAFTSTLPPDGGTAHARLVPRIARATRAGVVPLAIPPLDASLEPVDELAGMRLVRTPAARPVFATQLTSGRVRIRELSLLGDRFVHIVDLDAPRQSGLLVAAAGEEIVVGTHAHGTLRLTRVFAEPAGVIQTEQRAFDILSEPASPDNGDLILFPNGNVEILLAQDHGVMSHAFTNSH